MLVLTILKSQMWLRHFSQAKLAEQANKAQRPILMTWKIRHFLTSPSLYDEWVECHESPNAPLQLEVLWCFYFRRCLRGAPQSSTWVSCAWLEECVRLLNGCMSCREKEQILWQGGTQGELFRMRAWRGKKTFSLLNESCLFSSPYRYWDSRGTYSPRGEWNRMWAVRSEQVSGRGIVELIDRC